MARATGTRSTCSRPRSCVSARRGTNAAPYQDFNGSIANFRLFKRPLIEAEIHQLYDWEKVRFGRVALGDVVAFRDGSFGVGVAEPSRDDRLVVDGRANFTDVKTSRVVDRNDVVVYEQTGPHDRPLVKYPEIAMTANSSGGTWRVRLLTTQVVTMTFGKHTMGKEHMQEVRRTIIHRQHKGIARRTGHILVEPTQRHLRARRTRVSTYRCNFRHPSSSRMCASCPRAPRLITKTDRNRALFQIERWNDVDDDSHIFGITYSTPGASADIQASTDVAYTYIRLVVTHIDGTGGSGWLTMEEIEYYATEEGDASTDSKLTSVLNKPGRSIWKCIGRVRIPTRIRRRDGGVRSLWEWRDGDHNWHQRVRHRVQRVGVR